MAENRFPFLRHCFPRSLWPLWDRRTTWAMLALLALIGSLYLWHAGQIAEVVYQIQELEQTHERWQRENAETWKEITELTSVTVLSDRARALGFTEPQGEMFLRLRDAYVLTPAPGVSSD